MRSVVSGGAVLRETERAGRCRGAPSVARPGTGSDKVKVSRVSAPRGDAPWKEFGLPAKEMEKAKRKVEALGMPWPRQRDDFSFLGASAGKDFPLWPEPVTGATDIRMATGEIAPSGEHADWLERHDPVLRLGRQLAGQGAGAKARLVQLDADARARIDKAVTFALGSPLPAAETAFEHVFA